MPLRNVVLLAAGKSSRMVVLSNNEHKTHIKILGKSILQHSIEKALSYKLNVYVVSSPEHNLRNLLPEDILSKIEIILQDKPLGMGDAIEKAYGKIQDSFLVMNAYRLMDDSLLDIFSKKSETTLLLKKEENIKDYGCAEIKDGKVVSIEEKPSTKERGYKIRGIYYLSSYFIENYLSNHRGEYSLESALNEMAKKEGVEYEFYEKELPTLKYPWHYHSYFKHLINKIYPQSKVYGEYEGRGIVDTSAGPVIFGNSVKVMEGSVVKGPSYIGDGCVVGNNVLIRESNIEQGSLIGFGSEIVRTIMQSYSKVHSSYIGDSFLHKHFSSGFGFVTANRRIDRKKIKIEINGKINYLDRVGIFTGKQVSIGSNSTSMPGTIVREGSVIYPNIRFKGIIDGILRESNF